MERACTKFFKFGSGTERVRLDQNVVPTDFEGLTDIEQKSLTFFVF